MTEPADTPDPSIEHLDFPTPRQNPSCSLDHPRGTILALVRQPCRHDDNLMVCGLCALLIASLPAAQRWVCADCGLTYVAQTHDVITLALPRDRRA